MALDNPNEPYFLINDFLAEDKHSFDRINEKLDEHTQRWEEKAVFLKNFTNELYKAYRRNKPTDEQQRKAALHQLEQERIQKEEERAQLLKKKQELLARLEQLQHQSQSPTPQHQELIELPAPHSEKIIAPDPALQIQILINDTTIHEIICIGAQQPLTITKNGTETTTSIQFATEQALNTYLQSFAKQLNQPLSEENPFLNARLNDHTTIQANLGTQFIKAKFAIIKD